MDAHEGPSRWRRLALVAVAVIVAGTLALPASALAKTVTRLVVLKTVTVSNTDASATAWPYGLTVKLQKKVTSTHYHALTGTVKVYLYDVDDRAYYLVPITRKGSTISFPMPERGKYKFVYAGSSTTKPSTAYCTVMEDIGFVIGHGSVSVTPVGGSLTESWVTHTFTAGWNTTAWDWRVWFGADMWFQTSDSETLYYERWLKGPGTVEFTFKINNVDILEYFFDNAYAYVADWDDPYIAEGTVENGGEVDNFHDMWP
jgi:hypothetical protein